MCGCDAYNQRQTSEGGLAVAQPTLNQRVVVWAQGKVGKKVGRGLCWDLGERALKNAGAMTSNDLGPVEEDSDYIWGESKEVKDVEPGDILQLRDHLVTRTTVTSVEFPDGSGWDKTHESTAKRGHHTAIVIGTLDRNGAVRTLEQHVKPKGDVVQRLRLYTRDVPTTVTTERAKRKHPRTKKLQMAKVTRTVTVKVTGSIWAYKPMQE